MSDNKKQQPPSDGSSKSDKARRDISESFERQRDKITSVVDTLKPPPNDRGNTDNGKSDKSR